MIDEGGTGTVVNDRPRMVEKGKRAKMVSEMKSELTIEHNSYVARKPISGNNLIHGFEVVVF